MLNRYYIDLRSQLAECRRVLRPNRPALFVIGNSSIKGDHIKNSEFLKFAAEKVGFRQQSERIREIPDNRRYLPVSVAKQNALSSRMRTEHIIEFTA